MAHPVISLLDTSDAGRIYLGWEEVPSLPGERDRVRGKRTEGQMNEIEKIIKDSKTIAVVGMSNKLGRPSLTVASYLKGQGYRIIPVNPTIQEVNGERCYPDLASLPERVDIVDIFRRSEDVPPVVDEAIRTGAKAIWMQEGVVNEEAARKAREAGLIVVMDKCMLKEHSRLRREGKI